jgi:hypothetical protein
LVEKQLQEIGNENALTYRVTSANLSYEVGNGGIRKNLANVSNCPFISIDQPFEVVNNYGYLNYFYIDMTKATQDLHICTAENVRC